MRIKPGHPLVVAWIVTAAAMAADERPMCPAPAKAVQASCREITRKDLPQGAKALLQKLKCDVRAGSNYDYGSAVDLNGDGSPEYQVCCHEAPHGSCPAVLIGKVHGEWMNLTAPGGLSGYDGACTLFVILATERAGYHDVCLPDQCSPKEAKPGVCLPAIWQYENNRYHVTTTPASPSK
jgi:hypothetical protein